MQLSTGRIADAQFVGSTLAELRALIDATSGFPPDSIVSISLPGLIGPVERPLDRLIVRPVAREVSTDAAQG